MAGVPATIKIPLCRAAVTWQKDQREEDRLADSIARPRHIEFHRPWRWLRSAILDSRYMSDPEWLIGLGRLVTAAFAFIAIYFDPTQPARLADEARLLTVGYVLFSLFALIPIRWPLDSRIHLLTHAVDILVLDWLLRLTDQLTSPFFAFFHFTLLAATIRWGMMGALGAAVALEILLLLIGIPAMQDGVSQLNVMIMRSTYFLVAAFMLGYFGAYRNRSRYRLTRLAAWPRVKPGSPNDEWLDIILSHAREVLGAGKLIVVWQDIAQDTGVAAICAPDTLKVTTVSDPARWNRIIAAPGSGMSGGRPAFAAALEQLFDEAQTPTIRTLSSAPFAGARYRGRLFVLNARYRHDEIDTLAQIIASRISAELEHNALARQLAMTARTEERVRLARDMHDSVLQDLTAAGLKLKAASRAGGPQALQLMNESAAIIVDQQRRIRHFVEGTRAIEPEDGSHDALARYIDQLERRWECEIRLTTRPDKLRIPEQISDDVAQMISEATSNAVRHGEATRVDLSLALEDGVLQLGIADNGRGVREGDAGDMTKPLSLAARVADRSGRLSVTRRRPGFALMIELPVG